TGMLQVDRPDRSAASADHRYRKTLAVPACFFAPNPSNPMESEKLPICQSEVLAAVSTLCLSCKTAGKTRTLMHGLGFIWRISGEPRWPLLRTGFASGVAYVHHNATHTISAYQRLLFIHCSRQCSSAIRLSCGDDAHTPGTGPEHTYRYCHHVRNA